MKLFITIFFVCTLCISKAQIYFPDSSYTPGTIQGVTGTGIILNTQPYRDKPTLDTVPVIMLVCDTSFKELTGWYGTQQYFISDFQSDVKWRFGYSVRGKHCCVNGYTGEYAVYQRVPYYEHLYYLDDRKQRLSANIIVWQSISK